MTVDQPPKQFSERFVQVKRNLWLNAPSDTLFVLQVLNKAQLAKVQTAAKELRKVYCKKVMEKLCILMKATLKQLSKHFQVSQAALLLNPSRRRPLRVGQRSSWRTTGRSTVRATSSLSSRPSSGENYLSSSSAALSLSLPNIEVRPSVEEVQKMLCQVRLPNNEKIYY